MTNVQAMIIAVGISTAGLLHGGIWVGQGDKLWMINKFTGAVDRYFEAPKR